MCSQGITPYPNPVRIGPGLTIRGTHYVAVEAPAQSSKVTRDLADQVFNAPVVAVAPMGTMTRAQWVANFQTNFSSIATAVPPNVALLTFMAWDSPSKLLIRLGHMYAIGEDSSLSKPATVSLSTLFAGFTITDVEEVSLTANQNAAELRARRQSWKTVPDASDVSESSQHYDTPVAPQLSVTLGPMQIRTFFLTVG